MRMSARPLGIGCVVALAGLLLAPWEEAPTIHVSTADDLQAVVDSASEGSVVLLGPGTHSGGVVVSEPITVRGLPGAVLQADGEVPAVLTVLANGTVVEDLELRGGMTGLVAREAEGVIVREVAITGAELHGMEVIDAAAHISAVRVGGLRHPMAQGIEVRNSDGRPDTIVEGSLVDGGQEGIVSHVSEVVVRDNRVTNTTMRAITITEMSDGIVEDNSIAGVTGAGLYCGDMSRCEFADNDVQPVAGTSAGRSTEGWGLVVTYHAVASTDGDRLSGEAGPTFSSIGGHLRDDSPLDPKATSAAWLPVFVATAAALLVIGALYPFGGPVAVKLERAGPAPLRVVKPAGVWPLLVGGLAVQTFHMVEHGLQVFRVRIDQIPSRGGIVGPVVEAEWIHFIYNTTVFVGIALIALARAKGWRPPGRRDVGDRLLVVGLLAQGYHVVEHTAKLSQHIAGGAKVNPGFAGELVDLVLFHYSVNLLVYVALLGTALAYSYPTLAPAARRLLPLARPRLTTRLEGTP